MKEKYVVSPELAKQMKELGFPQESDFYWVGKEEVGYVAAYHVGELGEMMGERFLTKSHVGSGTKKLHWGVYSTYEEDVVNVELLYSHGYTSDTEADARASMLIYLAQNNLINPNEMTL